MKGPGRRLPARPDRPPLRPPLLQHLRRGRVRPAPARDRPHAGARRLAAGHGCRPPSASRAWPPPCRPARSSRGACRRRSSPRPRSSSPGFVFVVSAGPFPDPARGALPARRRAHADHGRRAHGDSQRGPGPRRLAPAQPVRVLGHARPPGRAGRGRLHAGGLGVEGLALPRLDAGADPALPGSRHGARVSQGAPRRARRRGRRTSALPRGAGTRASSPSCSAPARSSRCRGRR